MLIAIVIAAVSSHARNPPGGIMRTMRNALKITRPVPAATTNQKASGMFRYRLMTLNGPNGRWRLRRINKTVHTQEGMQSMNFHQRRAERCLWDSPSMLR
jgi:hypothetical protein